MSKIKIFAAAFFFIFCFALSFPFVIPGSSEPVFLHQLMVAIPQFCLSIIKVGLVIEQIFYLAKTDIVIILVH